MQAAKKQPEESLKDIALNRKARFNYQLEEYLEAGLVLQGWEVKSLRAGQGQISESYVVIRNQEAWLLNSVITPLISASTHVKTQADRTRKLLLKTKELKYLIGKLEQKGYTLVPVKMYFKKNKIKISIALAKGKKQYDKRNSDKDRDWQRDKARLFKKINN